MQILYGNPNIDYTTEMHREIAAIVKSGWVSIGEYVEALECFFKAKFNVKHAIGCSNATTGLTIAMKAAGWQDSAINLPAFTWPSTLYAVNCVNGTPLFHDIDPDTWLMQEPHHNHGKLVLVDTFGSVASPFEGFSKENTIIDAAHGYGLKDLGHRGIAEVVSLSFTKVVTAMEGGMILTNCDDLARVATELRRLSGRMGEINALVCIKSIEDREENHLIAWDTIGGLKTGIRVPHKCQNIPNETNHSVFSLEFEEPSVRNAIVVALAKAGCETKIYYDPLVSGFKNTDHVYNRILSLPTHKDVRPHIREIVEIINTAGEKGKTPGKEYLTQ